MIPREQPRLQAVAVVEIVVRRKCQRGVCRCSHGRSVWLRGPDVSDCTYSTNCTNCSCDTIPGMWDSHNDRKQRRDGQHLSLGTAVDGLEIYTPRSPEPTCGIHHWTRSIPF